ncbi:MAG TPA: ferredoxin reductase [Miltoncostaea sp.]|nr:ferredoxin reductase [Miltoncostaea sp.]
MARAALRGRLNWSVATVRAVVDETPRVRTLVFDVPGWPGHRPGQHVDVRLTADDGYRAERGYSIASAPGEPLAITVERLDEGEVSPYLTEVLQPGDRIELRGPIGGHFVWEPRLGGPVLMIAGGSGIAPFRSMLRHRRRTGDGTGVRLVYSARTADDVIYAGELAQQDEGVEIVLTLTRAQPPGWGGRSGRIDAALLRELAFPASTGASAYVCGPTSFVEDIARVLVGLAYPPERIKTERFGATG